MSQTDHDHQRGRPLGSRPAVRRRDAARAAIPALLDDCRAFRERYRGRVAELEAPELATALEELAALDNRLSRLASYSGLRLTTNVNGEAERDLNAAVEMALVEFQNAAALLRARVDRRRRRARRARARRRARSRATATTSRARGASRRTRAASPRRRCSPSAIPPPPAPGTRSSTRSPRRCACRSTARIARSTRSWRACAGPCARRAWRPTRRSSRRSSRETPVLAHVYDSLVADRLVLDRVRGYKHPREPRDLDNELPSAAVDVLLAAVERHHHLAHRWFRHKARLLGLDKLSLGDQYAPLGSTRAVAYDDATSLVDRRRSTTSRRASAQSLTASTATTASTPSRARASAAVRSAPRSPRTRCRTSC